jgi:hypothetical protein
LKIDDFRLTNEIRQAALKGPAFSVINGLAHVGKILDMRALFTAAILLSQFGLAQAVKVRVVNVNNGHPVAKQAVSVQFLYEKPPHASPAMHLETDSNGEAEFRIPEARPEHLNIRVGLDAGQWHCACWVMVDTATVVQKGIQRSAPSKSEAAIPAAVKPGEVLIAARPLTFFERLLYPLVKE